MPTLQSFSHNVRDTLDNIAEGWQHLWQKAKSAITHYSPQEGSDESNVPASVRSNRWGLLIADVKETDKSLEISLESPGMTPGDFDIKVERQTLIVCGQKNYESDRTQGRFHVTERAFGSFERLIPLPCLVNEDEALATYKNGVLHIVLPKKSKSGVRKITVT